MTVENTSTVNLRKMALMSAYYASTAFVQGNSGTVKIAFGELTEVSHDEAGKVMITHIHNNPVVMPLAIAIELRNMLNQIIGTMVDVSQQPRPPA